MTVNALSKYGIDVLHETSTNTVLRLSSHDESVKMSRRLYTEMYLASINPTRSSMTTNNVSFGIEFEFIGSSKHEDRILFDVAMIDLVDRSYYNAGKYAHNDGSCWILGKDSSIQYNDAPSDDFIGYELSTPKLNLSNPDDLALLNKVINTIKTCLHGYTNNSCGTHIHISIIPDKKFKSDIRNVLCAYSSMESRVFDPIVPLSRRKNRYCKQTTDFINNKYQKVSSRYCKFDPYNECKCLHFEFRQLEGTLDYNTIINWATLHAHVMTDLIEHSNDKQYLSTFSNCNTFNVLFKYPFTNELISFFVDRVIRFKSRSIQSV